MSRELYDLCRRYKYFYNKHKDVVSWHHKYHDINLSEIIHDVELDLRKVEDDLMIQLLDEMEVVASEIRTENEIPCWDNSFGTRLPLFHERIHSTTDATFKGSRRFIYLLIKYLEDKGRYIG